MKKASAAIFAMVSAAALAVVYPLENDYLEVFLMTPQLEVGEDINLYNNDLFGEESGSEIVSRKFTGLPGGITFDAKNLKLKGSPNRAGVYYVTYTAKNKNNFTHSMMSEWVVGDASTGDYDNIGLDWDSLERDYDVIWQTGREIMFSLYYISGDLDLYDITASGLPPGLQKPTCAPALACGYPPGSYRGMLSKAGKYKVTVTAKDYNGRQIGKAVKTIIVQDGGCRYVNVVSGNPAGGTVGGSKVYACGAKATISARPKAGYVFAGWYADNEFKYPLRNTASGDYRKASDSFVVSCDGPLTVYARFVAKANDFIALYAPKTWEVQLYGDNLFIELESGSLPTVTVKNLPAGIKWDKTSLRFYVEDTAKLKPGSNDVTIIAKNLSGYTSTAIIRVSVPNIESWVFSGLEYSSDVYRLTVGVCDACIAEWIYFEYEDSYKVSASGLPPGLKAEIRDGYVAIHGTPTKAGVYTVTLTAKRGSRTEKATVTVNVDPLPDCAVGTFNGILRDGIGDVVGSFTFTAAANGKQSVKVVTELGTMSLSAFAWNCYDDAGRPMAYFSKYASNEDFVFMLVPQDGANWNCEHQLEGTLSWTKSSTSGESSVEAMIDSAQRNPFGKTGNAYDHTVAVKVAESLASEYKSMKMVILWDSDLNAYMLECADCVESGCEDGTATLKMNKNGTATVSGKLYNLYSFTATSTLAFDTPCGIYGTYRFGEHCHAIFTPVVKMKVCTACCGDEYRCTTQNQIVPIFWNPILD